MPEASLRPRLRRALLGVGSLLALLALVRAGFPPWLTIVLALFAVLLVGDALRRAPRAIRVDLSEPGLMTVDDVASGPWRGRHEPLFTSGVFCAFRVRDPARGNRLFGLFRDELSPDAWRRLQVRLRAEAPAAAD